MEETGVVREVCSALEELGKDELLSTLTSVVEYWLSNKEMDPAMLYLGLLMGFGKGGAVLINLLKEEPVKVTSQLDLCLESTENRLAVYRVRGFVAKYHPLVYVESRKRLAPHLTRQLIAIPIKKNPVIVRIEARLNNGENVVLEIDVDDVNEILEAVKGADRGELLGLLTRFLDDSRNIEADEGENDDTNGGVASNRCPVVMDM